MPLNTTIESVPEAKPTAALIVLVTVGPQPSALDVALGTEPLGLTQKTTAPAEAAKPIINTNTAAGPIRLHIEPLALNVRCVFPGIPPLIRRHLIFGSVEINQFNRSRSGEGNWTFLGKRKSGVR